MSELLRGDEMCRLTAVGLAEVIDHLVRRCGADEDEAVLDLAQLGLTDAVPVSSATATRAGLLQARHYHRRDRAVSLADCIAAATAQMMATAVVTSDQHLLDMCREEHIDVIVLHDGTGQISSPHQRPAASP